MVKKIFLIKFLIIFKYKNQILAYNKILKIKKNVLKLKISIKEN